MIVVNNSRESVTFDYGGQTISLEPGGLFDFDAFDFNKINDIKKLISQGLFTLLDDTEEGFEEFLDGELQINQHKADKILAPRSLFSKLNFDNDVM